jgi:hypothetical protein
MSEESEPTVEQIQKHYAALGHSVDLINNIIADPSTDDEPKVTVQRNVTHLSQMITQDFWTTEDMTAVNAAIVAGNNYLS